MGMKNYANSGYVVEINELMPLFNETEQEELTALIEVEEVNLEAVESWLSSHGLYVDLYQLTTEDESETFLPGEILVIFDEAELFEMSPTKYHNDMLNTGVNIRRENWTTWG